MKELNKENLFSELPDATENEVFDIFARSETCKIERIVSNGQVTTPGQWYDQDCNEWVAVLKGQAILEYQDGSKLELTEGDHVLIPAHKKHRVAQTSSPTIWLAVHFS